MNNDAGGRAGKIIATVMCTFGLLFVAIWCLIAWISGAGFMILFAVPFVIAIIAVMAGVRKAGKKKAHTCHKAEEPWEHDQSQEYTAVELFVSDRCPYCSRNVEEDFLYCPYCGRRIR